MFNHNKNEANYKHFHFYFNSLYFDVAMRAIPIIRMMVWLGWKVPKNVQAAEPRANTKPAQNCIGFGFFIQRLLLIG